MALILKENSAFNADKHQDRAVSLPRVITLDEIEQSGGNPYVVKYIVSLTAKQDGERETIIATYADGQTRPLLKDIEVGKYNFMAKITLTHGWCKTGKEEPPTHMALCRTLEEADNADGGCKMNVTPDMSSKYYVDPYKSLGFEVSTSTNGNTIVVNAIKRKVILKIQREEQ